MFSIAKRYKTSEKLATGGFWYTPDYCRDDENPPRFKLARKHLRSNRKYQARMTQYAIENKRQLARPTMHGYEQAETAALKVFCEAVLLDWAGIYGDDGNLVEYSVEQGIALMTECPDLYEELDDIATDRQNYVEEDAAEIAGK